MRTRERGKLRSLGWPALAAGLALAIGVGDARAAFPGANGRVAFAVEKWRLPDPCLPIPHGCERLTFGSAKGAVSTSFAGSFTLPQRVA